MWELPIIQSLVRPLFRPQYRSIRGHKQFDWTPKAKYKKTAEIIDGLNRRLFDFN